LVILLYIATCKIINLYLPDMDKLKISTAQFENRSGDKTYNL